MCKKLRLAACFAGDARADRATDLDLTNHFIFLTCRTYYEEVRPRRGLPLCRRLPRGSAGWNQFEKSHFLAFFTLLLCFLSYILDYTDGIL